MMVTTRVSKVVIIRLGDEVREETTSSNDMVNFGLDNVSCVLCPLSIGVFERSIDSELYIFI